LVRKNPLHFEEFSHPNDAEGDDGGHDEKEIAVDPSDGQEDKVADLKQKGLQSVV